MICSACATVNVAGAKFCNGCGARLATGCPSCGASNAPGARFCNDCGTRLDVPASPAAAPAHATASELRARPGFGATADGIAPAAGAAPSAPSAPAAVPATAATERRLVTVLFADLVGFTTLAADRDSEAVRDLLTRYFDTASEIVGRYGGTIEKFIGDAVMAVWGTPVAQEDDAERAVRTALDLLVAVRGLDSGADGRGLEARAGVLTGEATVTLGATNQGMVAGDLVNTASRLQSAAPPGTVLVGEATYRSTSRAIAYEEAGEQVLRGKTAPVASWRALRVVGKRGGEGRTEGLEAPFVGRDDELRLLKDFFHATSRERRARLVSVTGQAGIGKSRLAWEFLKYIDGVLETVYWHQGRSPAYGEGITFWALGEMVRRRAGLAEGDDERTTRERLAATLAEFVPEEAEQRWLGPALLFLLGFGDAPAGGRDGLFAAWRTFFERIAARDVTVLVFEDLQWADAGLLDFIDHLLEWSVGYPLYVVTLARPELVERRRDWGAGRRNFVALALQPLPEPAMRQLLAGLVPGLPEGAVRTILERADGIPLYAVETVRMLVAEGKLEQVDNAYRPTADLTSLAVPESLHALIAARLDALEPGDRSLLQDGAVLGQTFPLPALAALTGDPPEALEPRLRALARREVVVLDTDPRSPERGQWGFTQALIREVAYSTLSRRERRSRHLAAARFFEALGDEEVTGVLATHYLDAYLASPEGPEGASVAAQARIALRAAADRASDLGSHEQAVAFLTRALDATANPSDAAELRGRIGNEQGAAGMLTEAEASLRQAVDAYRELGDALAEARAAVALGELLVTSYEQRAALALLEPYAATVDSLEPAVAVDLLAQLGRAHFFNEQPARAVEWLDRALVQAERQGIVPVILDALISKGVSYGNLGRLREGIGLVEAGMHMAEREGLTSKVLRAQINLSAMYQTTDAAAGVRVANSGFEAARRLGMRHMMVLLGTNALEAAIPVGDWKLVTQRIEELLEADVHPTDRAAILGTAVEMRAVQGRDLTSELAELTSIVGDDRAPGGISTTLLQSRMWARMAAGDRLAAYEDAMASAEISALNAPFVLPHAARLAVRLGDVDRARAALAFLDRIGIRGPTLDAERALAEAGLDALAGAWPEASARYQDATRRLRQLGLEFDLALALVDIAALGPADDDFVTAAEAEAREILTRIGALPALADLDGIIASRSDEAHAAGRRTRATSRSTSGSHA